MPAERPAGVGRTGAERSGRWWSTSAALFALSSGHVGSRPGAYHRVSIRSFTIHGAGCDGCVFLVRIGAVAVIVSSPVVFCTCSPLLISVHHLASYILIIIFVCFDCSAANRDLCPDKDQQRAMLCISTRCRHALIISSCSDAVPSRVISPLLSRPVLAIPLTAAGPTRGKSVSSVAVCRLMGSLCCLRELGLSGAEAELAAPRR